ncbi:hypothetical protein RE0356_10330 [Prescottella equi]|nr:hypothetical protein RE9414_10350 [Prescottella equi]BCN82392.1 hypothetical protein RE0356_10330 [Prescottella equi]
MVPVLNMPDVAVVLPDQAAIVPTAPSPRTIPRDRTARVRVQTATLIRPPIRAVLRVSWSRAIVLPYFASVVSVTLPVRSVCAFRVDNRLPGTLHAPPFDSLAPEYLCEPGPPTARGSRRRP